MITRPPTEFEQRVYDLVRCVPTGRVVTYATLARTLDCGSAQAVGQALKRNPFAPEVPCHRVIRTDLSIGGYVGATAGEKVKKKYCLLKDEGVDFDGEGQLLDESIVYVFEGGRSNEITFL